MIRSLMLLGKTSNVPFLLCNETFSLDTFSAHAQGNGRLEMTAPKIL